MTTVNRGGVVMATGKIGVIRCVRQQLLYPGETVKTSINGQVNLETLRERDGVPINARLDVFLTPLRWLWSDYPDWLREGPATSKTPPVESGNVQCALLGIGNDIISGVYKFWQQALLRIYNEHYKHPEIADKTAIGTSDNALPAVPLPISWSRMRTTFDVDNTSDVAFTLPSSRSLDIRTLREVEQKYIAAQQRENLTYERWIPMLREMYNSRGSNEVDKVPFHVDEV
ncbi:MAG: major capsid protein, partial [Candidatus Poribacteria bacterium]|nr:major capsid protein [Candidatus Poribacteria bacterium]